MHPAAVDVASGRVAVAREAAIELYDDDEEVPFASIELVGATALVFGRSGKLFAATANAVHLVDIEGGGTPRLVEHGLRGASSLVVDADERLLAVAYGPELVLCDLDEWSRRGRASYGARDVVGLCFAAGGHLTVALDDGTTEARDVAPPRPPEEAHGSEEPAPPMVLTGNRLRGSGVAIALFGVALDLVVLVSPWGPRASVMLGAIATLIAIVGVARWLGSFDDEITHPTLVRAGNLAPPLFVAGLSALGLWAVLLLTVRGTLGPGAALVLVPVGTLAVVYFVARLLMAVGVLSRDRPIHRREGFWLVVLASVVLLPMLGSHGLIDPWETHYGEVSREILARDDWISLWWAQEDWFFSKPILDFWIQALAMAGLGVHFEPGQMLVATSEGAIPAPEWAVRYPMFVLATLAAYLLYKATAASFGRRAGLFAGVVLTTMPAWFFLSHQTMTDMPFVATMTAAMALFLLGAREDPERRIVTYGVRLGRRAVSLSAHQLVVAGILALTLPQILYLVTRNLQLNLDPVFGLRLPPIRFAVDTFVSGSAGNCGEVPGNAPCNELLPVHPGLQPWLQALIWLLPVLLTLYLVWGERRSQRLYFLGGYLFIALSCLAKGPAGAAIPLLAIVGYFVATKRYRLFLQMELAAGILLLVAIVMPWFVAMVARHGHQFVDRLLIHDMLKRATEHVHDTNRTDDTSFRYYVWQLGYATFPWVGILPAALLTFIRAPRRPTDDDAHRGDARGTVALYVVWIAVGFALFSYMPTKFHHYIFPVIPPLAALVGVWLDRVFVPRAPLGTWQTTLAAIVGPGAAVVWAVCAPSVSWAILAPLLLLGVSAIAVLTLGRRERSSRDPYFAALGTVVSTLGAGLVFLVGRDMASRRPHQPADARLLDLFTYNYERPWPKSLDFSGPLWGFTVAAGLVLLIAAFPRARAAMGVAFVGLSAAFAAWALDVYFVEVSPHWGQRELVLEYHEERRTAPGPLVAYEMNWKGENFYTGNQVAAFVESGKPFRDWIHRERKRGQRTFYFVCLADRQKALLSQLGRPADVEALTDADDNNKFVLLRARYD